MNPSRSFLRVILMIGLFILPIAGGPFAIIYYLLPPAFVDYILHGYLSRLNNFNLNLIIGILIDLLTAYAFASVLVYLYDRINHKINYRTTKKK
jgi:preprotein translocase subunit SecF